METIIAINDDGLFPKCDTLSMGRKQPKNTREKGTKIKDATIRNKFTETINVLICTAISTQKVTHPSNYLESKKKKTALGNQLALEQKKTYDFLCIRGWILHLETLLYIRWSSL